MRIRDIAVVLDDTARAKTVLTMSDRVVSTVVVECLRIVDPGIIGQAEPDTSFGSMAHTVLDDAILWSARPVLAIPFAGRFDTIGKNVLIAWRNTRRR
jgi:hypothetical protein